MKLFYIAVFLVVSALPIGFVGMFAAWDQTPVNLRLIQLDRIVQTGAMIYIGLIVCSLVLFLVFCAVEYRKVPKGYTVSRARD